MNARGGAAVVAGWVSSGSDNANADVGIAAAVVAGSPNNVSTLIAAADANAAAAVASAVVAGWV